MPAKLIEITPNALDVLYSSARQCYYSGIIEYPFQSNNKEDLIKQIISSGHDSILEHINFTFSIFGVSRSLLAQLTRHRHASYAVQSQRFCGSKELNYITPPTIEGNKNIRKKYDELMNDIFKLYNAMIQEGILKEDARYVLPNSWNTNLVLTINCRSLINFFSLRLCKNAQWEIRDLAKDMLKICQKELPVVFEHIGPRCQQLGYCIEKKSCGRKPLKKSFFEGE